jgi:hypothetical protein
MTPTGWSPRWSPQEDRIAHVGSDGIYVTRSDGTVSTRIFSTAGAAGLDW